MLANLVYLAAICAASPWILYRMLRHGRYRRGVSQKLFGLSGRAARRLRKPSPVTPLLDSGSLVEDEPASDDVRCIWLHAVSVGEVNLLPTLVRRLKRQAPGVQIVVSSSTDAGFDLARKHFGDHRVFFCPLDFTWAVRRTIRQLRPELIVLTELELWPNLIQAASDAGCGVAVINGRLGAQSAARYQKFRRLTRSLFSTLCWVGCQDETCRDRFEACGVDPQRLAVTGSMKFDNAFGSRDHPDVQMRAQWAGVDPWHRVWVVGSTQAGEEAMALSIYKELRTSFPELRLVLVPRHAERFEAVATEIQQNGFFVHRRSTGDSLFDTEWSSERVILVDTIGELRLWWGICQIATVGGSFGTRGGQNMLEPAGYGAAVSFGPNTRNFDEIARRLIDAGGAVRVHDRTELAEFVRRCLADPPSADGLGRAARSVVQQHRGATDRTVAALLEKLSSPPRSRSHAA